MDDTRSHVSGHSSPQEVSRASQQSQNLQNPTSILKQQTTGLSATEPEDRSRPENLIENDAPPKVVFDGHQVDPNQGASSPIPSMYMSAGLDVKDHPQRRLSTSSARQPASNYNQEYDHRKPWTRYPLGYPRFSAFIANDEDRSTTIFRRFQRLSTRNLLYLESELADLEQEQDRLDQESLQDDDLRLSMMSWDLLCLQATPPRNELKVENPREEERRIQLQAAATQRLHLAWRIREVIKTYHEALKRESEVLALSSPDRRPLKGTRRIFMPTYDERRGTGTGAPMIHGAMRTHLDKENILDLCVLAPPVEKDRLTRLLEGRLSYFFRTRNNDGLSDFVSHTRVSVAVSLISGLLATVFLIGAILGLYWVTNPNAKLGMLSGLTAGFAGSLALFTNARRQDVFASTAAYAAVLVVFVSGNLASSGGGTSTSSPIETPTVNSMVSIITSVVKQTSIVIITATSTTALEVTTALLNSVTASPTVSVSISAKHGLSSSSKTAIIVGSILGGITVLVTVWVMLFCCRRTARA